MKPPCSNLDLEHSNGAYRMRLTRGENGTRTVAPVDLGDAVPTSKDLSELPPVKNTIDVAWEDAEANVPAVVTTPKEPRDQGMSVKAASDLLVRFFLAMLDAWGRSDVRVLPRAVQEVTLALLLREVHRAN